MHEYSQEDLRRLFGLPAAVIAALVGARYIAPTRAQGKTGYSFQDLLILRTAAALKAAKIENAKIVAALGFIRSSLPPGSLLTTLALAASDNTSSIAGVQGWEDSSERRPPALPPSKGAVGKGMNSRPSRPAAHLQAESHYARGHSLEETDVAASSRVSGTPRTNCDKVSTRKPTSITPS